MKTKRTLASLLVFTTTRFFGNNEQAFLTPEKNGIDIINIWMMFFFSIGAVGIFFSLIINLKKKGILLAAY